MRALLPLFALGLTAVSGMADSTDDLCIEIAEMVESGSFSEKQALEVLQKTIDQAKEDLEAYKPSDATIVERLLSAKELTASVKAAYSPGCTVDEKEPVKFVRKQDQVTVEVDKNHFDHSKPRRQTFSLTSEAEGEKVLRESFETWCALVRQLAVSPPECKWLAETTPAKLLKRGRSMHRQIGGSGFCYITVTLKDEQGELVIEETTGAHLQEAFMWHASLLKALPDSGSKPTAEPAAR